MEGHQVLWDSDNRGAGMLLQPRPLFPAAPALVSRSPGPLFPQPRPPFPAAPAPLSRCVSPPLRGGCRCGPGPSPQAADLGAAAAASLARPCQEFRGSELGPPSINLSNIPALTPPGGSLEGGGPPGEGALTEQLGGYPQVWGAGEGVPCSPARVEAPGSHYPLQGRTPPSSTDQSPQEGPGTACAPPSLSP